MNKNLLRREYILKRNRLTPQIIATKSETIFENFKSLFIEKEQKRVLVYLPIKNEVETKLIIRYLRLNNAALFLPAYKNKAWIVSGFGKDSNLASGPFSTNQPEVIKPALIQRLDLAIIPGVLFSKNGIRLGYGKGVYDKLLKNFRGLKVGLGYDFQVVNDLPYDPHDVKMDYLISESAIITTQG